MTAAVERAAAEPRSYPSGGKRLLIYVVYDIRGEVEDYVLHALAGLRPHVSHVMVVVNGALTDSGRDRLVPLCDRILVRQNLGFDIGAQRDALLEIGPGVSDFDEVVLTNDTWFGPVHPFASVFDRMNNLEIDVWGLTEHPAADGFARHLQSFWLAVRRRVLDSREWREYWERMPLYATYWDAVVHHEVRFTEWAEAAGFLTGAAFPAERYPVANASIYAADLLLADGCPTVKRRPFFHDPPFLARHAIIGRWLMAAMRAAGYPVELARANLARTVAPRVLQANLAALEVAEEHELALDHHDERLLVVVHTDDPAAARRFIDRLPQRSGSAHVVVVASSESHASVLEEYDLARTTSHPLEVRVADCGRSAEVGAVVSGAADLISNGQFDLVLAAAPATIVAQSSPAERYRMRYAEENLVAGDPLMRDILGQFASDPSLGLMFPPLRLIATPAGFREWGNDRAVVEELAHRLSIRVPLDAQSPLAPSDGVWIARPEALGLLAHTDIADVGASALRRLLVLAAAESGFSTRTVLTAEHAAIAHTSLEFASDVASSTTLGWPNDQIDFLDRAHWRGEAGLAALLRVYLRMHRPRWHRRLAGAHALARWRR